MTTIAYRNGILAADRKAITSNASVFSVTKARKISGWLFAISGEMMPDAAVRAMIEERLAAGKGMEGIWGQTGWKDEGYVSGYLISPEGVIYRIESAKDGTIAGAEVDAEFVACGSGRDFALAAMALGRSATQAVELAIQFDPNTGAGVETVELDTGWPAPISTGEGRGCSARDALGDKAPQDVAGALRDVPESDGWFRIADETTRMTIKRDTEFLDTEGRQYQRRVDAMVGFREVDMVINGIRLVNWKYWEPALDWAPYYGPTPPRHCGYHLETKVGLDGQNMYRYVPTDDFVAFEDDGWVNISDMGPDELEDGLARAGLHLTPSRSRPSETQDATDQPAQEQLEQPQHKTPGEWELPEGFIAHDGGECPILASLPVDVIFESGKMASGSHEFEGTAAFWHWPHDGKSDKITGYRIAGLPEGECADETAWTQGYRDGQAERKGNWPSDQTESLPDYIAGWRSGYNHRGNPTADTSRSGPDEPRAMPEYTIPAQSENQILDAQPLHIPSSNVPPDAPKEIQADGTVTTKFGGQTYIVDRNAEPGAGPVFSNEHEEADGEDLEDSDQRLERIWREGHDAYARDIAVWQVPYEGSVEQDEWTAGWTTAERQATPADDSPMAADEKVEAQPAEPAAEPEKRTSGFRGLFGVKEPA